MSETAPPQNRLDNAGFRHGDTSASWANIAPARTLSLAV